MKIRCDVCDGEEASVFCTADEAALCEGCDTRVHHANKLAGKHTRFSLLQPNFKQAPLCDICQERRAFVFCQEDRAILCRECDIPIHRANEHTQNHNRFLLTGVKLSPFSSSYDQTASPVSTAGSEFAGDRSKAKSSSSNQKSPVASTTTTTSSISEYLMETLPGWHVDEFLDPSSSSFDSSNGFFCKTNSQIQGYDDDDTDFESNKNFLSSVSSQDLVPQHFGHTTTFYPSSNSNNGDSSTFSYSVRTEDMTVNMNWDDISSTVPQINPPTFKRHRHYH